MPNVSSSPYYFNTYTKVLILSVRPCIWFMVSYWVGDDLETTLERYELIFYYGMMSVFFWLHALSWLVSHLIAYLFLYLLYNFLLGFSHVEYTLRLS